MITTFGPDQQCLLLTGTRAESFTTHVSRVTAAQVQSADHPVLPDLPDHPDRPDQPEEKQGDRRDTGQAPTRTVERVCQRQRQVRLRPHQVPY